MDFIRDPKNKQNLVYEDNEYVYVISQKTVYVFTAINKKSGQNYPQAVFETLKDARHNANSLQIALKNVDKE